MGGIARCNLTSRSTRTRTGIAPRAVYPSTRLAAQCHCVPVSSGVKPTRMTNATQPFDEAAAVLDYLRLMHELAMRVDLVARACTGALNLSPPFAREYCFLQFRRMCELVALGCLQLHGDLSAARTGAAKKEWNAERIMRLLHRSHPHAFPQSLTRIKTSNGWSLVANSRPNALTYAEFNALYNKCGEILHRGTIRSLETEQALAKSQYDEVIAWSHKVVDLLNEHVISRSDGKGLYHISLRTDAGGPACSFFSGFGEGSVQVATYNLDVRATARTDDGSVPNPSVQPTAYGRG